MPCASEFLCITVYLYIYLTKMFHVYFVIDWLTHATDAYHLAFILVANTFTSSYRIIRFEGHIHVSALPDISNGNEIFHLNLRRKVFSESTSLSRSGCSLPWILRTDSLNEGYISIKTLCLLMLCKIVDAGIDETTTLSPVNLLREFN